MYLVMKKLLVFIIIFGVGALCDGPGNRRQFGLNLRPLEILTNDVLDLSKQVVKPLELLTRHLSSPNRRPEHGPPHSEQHRPPGSPPHESPYDPPHDSPPRESPYGPPQGSPYGPPIGSPDNPPPRSPHGDPNRSEQGPPLPQGSPYGPPMKPPRPHLPMNLGEIPIPPLQDSPDIDRNRPSIPPQPAPRKPQRNEKEVITSPAKISQHHSQPETSDEASDHHKLPQVPLNPSVTKNAMGLIQQNDNKTNKSKHEVQDNKQYETKKPDHRPLTEKEEENKNLLANINLDEIFGRNSINDDDESTTETDFSTTTSDYETTTDFDLLNRMAPSSGLVASLLG